MQKQLWVQLAVKTLLKAAITFSSLGCQIKMVLCRDACAKTEVRLGTVVGGVMPAVLCRCCRPATPYERHLSLHQVKQWDKMLHTSDQFPRDFKEIYTKMI